MAPAAGKNDEAMDNLIAGIASLNIQPRGLYSLPNELLQPIFNTFEDDRDTLKSLRLVCANFSDLTNGLLFRALRFYRHPKDWSEIHALLRTPKIAKCVKSLECAVSAASAVGMSHNLWLWPCRPSDPYHLTLDCLKPNDYRYLLAEPMSLGLNTNTITTLHIDTTTSLLDEEMVNRPKPETCFGWKPRFGCFHLSFLRRLIITQNPLASPAVDVLYLLREVSFCKLEIVELNSVRLFAKYAYMQDFYHVDYEDERVIFDGVHAFDPAIKMSKGEDWASGNDLLPKRVWRPI
ncbi:MAG: hypothetical protein Q9221_005185 [Calogaya cf. arnoldii]